MQSHGQGILRGGVRVRVRVKVRGRGGGRVRVKVRGKRMGIRCTGMTPAACCDLPVRVHRGHPGASKRMWALVDTCGHIIVPEGP